MKHMANNGDSPLCITINYRASTIRVFKSVFLAFDNPRYLQFWINPDVRKLFVRGTNVREEHCLEIPPEAERKKSYYVFHGQRFIKRICHLADWSLDQPHAMIGTYIEDVGVVSFNFMETDSHESTLSQVKYHHASFLTKNEKTKNEGIIHDLPKIPDRSQKQEN